jgi:predicted RNA-binding protein with PIN domain
MRFLVDGNNLLGARGGASPAGDAARRELVRALCALWRYRGKPVTVVFDGPAPVEGGGGAQLGGVRVLHAGGGRTAMSADERILRMVEGENRPADVTVVTSDRGLASGARRRGATVLPCPEFRSMVQEALAQDAGSEKPTHVDVREWADYFGVDPHEDVE